MSTKHRLCGICLLALLALGLYLSANSAVAQTNSAESEFQAANNAIGQAFTAVADAENAGANVTDFVVQLNGAVGLLASAENSGSPDIVAAQVDSIISISQGVTVAAEEAKQAALVLGQNAYWSNILLSVILAFIFGSTLFSIWRWLKKRHTTYLSNVNPQAVRLWI